MTREKAVAQLQKDVDMVRRWIQTAKTLPTGVWIKLTVNTGAWFKLTVNTEAWVKVIRFNPMSIACRTMAASAKTHKIKDAKEK